MSTLKGLEGEKNCQGDEKVRYCSAADSEELPGLEGPEGSGRAATTRDPCSSHTIHIKQNQIEVQESE
jgi:hypothetical protein